MVSNIGKFLEKLDLSYISGGKVKWYTYGGKRLHFLKKLNIHLPYNPAMYSRHLPKRMLNFCLHKNLYTNVQSSFVYNNQTRNNPTVPPLVNGETTGNISIL